MKENELVMMRNKIESLTRIIDFMLTEIDNTKTMSIGVYQLIKEMPGYNEAIEKLKQDTEKNELE